MPKFSAVLPSPPRRPAGRRRGWLADIVLGLLMVCGVAGILWYRAQDPDLRRLELGAYRRILGPDKASRGGEEWFIRDFFRDRIGGVFVLVGDYLRADQWNLWFMPLPAEPAIAMPTSLPASR
jgi:hypothetical protein